MARRSPSQSSEPTDIPRARSVRGYFGLALRCPASVTPGHDLSVRTRIGHGDFRRHHRLDRAMILGRRWQRDNVMGV